MVSGFQRDKFLTRLPKLQNSGGIRTVANARTRGINGQRDLVKATTSRVGVVAVCGAAGLIYGVLLSIYALAFSGFGHGSYVPVLVFSAPLGFFGYASAFFLAPFLWLAVGIAIGAGGRRATRMLIALLVLHWVSAVCLGVVEYNPSDWRVIYRFWSNGLVSRSILVSGFSIYLIGQLVALVTVALRLGHDTRLVDSRDDVRFS